MIKKLVFTFIISCLGYGLNAQQLPMYSQFYWNDFAINPAYTGLTDHHEFNWDIEINGLDLRVLQVLLH